VKSLYDVQISKVWVDVSAINATVLHRYAVPSGLEEHHGTRLLCRMYERTNERRRKKNGRPEVECVKLGPEVGYPSFRNIELSVILTFKSIRSRNMPYIHHNLPLYLPYVRL